MDASDRVCGRRAAWSRRGRVALAAVLAAVAGACERSGSPGEGVQHRSPEAAAEARADPTPPGVIRFGREAPEPAPAGTIRVASYNIENLFDDHDDPSLSGDNDDAGETKPVAEREAAAEAIRAIDADVLALQEVESERALRWFRDHHLAEMGYEHIASVDAGNARGIEQSVLSRFPITDVENWPGRELGGVHPEMYGDEPNWHAGEPLVYRRSPMLASVRVPSEATGGEPYELTLAVVHHKSGRHNHYWREAEAGKLIEILSKRQADRPGANMLVLGDFNATIEDKSVQLYLDAGWRDLLAGAAADGDDPARTHASGRRIDLVLANEAAGAEVVEGSGFVLGTPVRPAGVDWRSTPNPDGWASDHFPVVVDLRPREETE